MKAILRVYNILLLVSALSLSNTVFAEDDPKVERKKNYSKSYDVGANDKVSFDNRFGELKITTWNKNEVKVDVTMTSKANTDARAQEILDRIKIEDGKNSSGVYFKTKLENEDKKHDKNDREKYRNEGFTIDYVVYMPTRNPLVAKNEFGKMIIPDYSGEVEVVSKFGNLTAGNLPNVKSIRVEFGDSEISSINNGKLNIQFSGRSVVNRVSGAVDVSLQHSGGVKLVVDNNVKSLDIKNDFSHLYLDVNKNMSANFDISTNFGEFSNKSDFNISQTDKESSSHGPKFRHSYSGKAGGGSSPVKIRSEFGQVTVGHNLEMKVTEKNKGKKKTRSI